MLILIFTAFAIISIKVGVHKGFMFMLILSSNFRLVLSVIHYRIILHYIMYISITCSWSLCFTAVVQLVINYTKPFKSKSYLVIKSHSNSHSHRILLLIDIILNKCHSTSILYLSKLWQASKNFKIEFFSFQRIFFIQLVCACQLFLSDFKIR